MNQDDHLMPVERRDLFRFLILLQAAGVSVAESERVVGETFGVSGEVVKRIEREGVELKWPPL